MSWRLLASFAIFLGLFAAETVESSTTVKVMVTLKTYLNFMQRGNDDLAHGLDQVPYFLANHPGS